MTSATGYKWNLNPDVASAVDLPAGTTEYTEQGLTCTTGYTRYVWAFNVFGVSAATTLT